MLFPQFDPLAFLEGKPPSAVPPQRLGGLAGLGGQVLPFEKRLASLSAEQREAWEERAGIMEFDGGLSREEAERQALDNVIYVNFGGKP